MFPARPGDTHAGIRKNPQAWSGNPSESGEVAADGTRERRDSGPRPDREHPAAAPPGSARAGTRPTWWNGRQGEDPARRAEQRARQLPQEGDADQAVGDPGARPRGDGETEGGDAQEEERRGRQLAPAASMSATATRWRPATPAPAHASTPASSASARRAPRRARARPASQRRGSPAARAASRDAGPSPRGGRPPTCAAAKRLSASTKKRKSKPRAPGRGGDDARPSCSSRSWRLSEISPRRRSSR